tara:strand:+ start:1859 stop:2257 length:399 start_codon:yes stop_codon:yes gene_type:complete
MKRKLYNVIDEVELIKKKINHFSSKNKQLIKQFLSVLKEGNEDDILSIHNHLISWKKLKYIFNFSIVDWQDKKIYIKEKDHNKGKNPFIQIYKGTKNFIDISNDVIINLSNEGNIEIINLNKIDFTGKIIIL